MDDDAIPQHRTVVKHGVGIDGHVVAESTAPTNYHPGIDAAARPDPAAFADRGERKNANVGRQLDAGVNGCARVDTKGMHRGPHGPFLEITNDGHESGERISDLNQRNPGLGHRARGHGRGCPTVRKQR